MRFCYAGPVWSKPPQQDVLEAGMDGAHSCNAVGGAFSEAFASMGIRLDQWNFWHTDPVGVKTSDAYDGVILWDHSMLPLWERVVPDWDWKRKLSVFWVHAVRLYRNEPVAHACRMARDKATLIGFTDESILDDFRELYGDRSGLFVLRYGCRSRDWSDVPPTPYPPGKPVMLWCARIGPRAFEYLIRLEEALPGYQLHILSSTPSEQAGMTSRLPGTYHGCFKYGTFDRFLFHADVALDVAVSNPQTVINSKCYDYLAAGLPVAHESVPGTQLIDLLRHGRSAAYDRFDEYVATVAESARIPPVRRRFCREYMASHHTWRHRAMDLLNELLPLL